MDHNRNISFTDEGSKKDPTPYIDTTQCAKFLSADQFNINPPGYNCVHGRNDIPRLLQKDSKGIQHSRITC